MTSARGRGKARFHHYLLGMIVGALCGFLTYWIGDLLWRLPALVREPPPSVVMEIMRPVQVVTAWELVLVLTGALLGIIVARYRWHSAGLLSYLSLVSMIAGYVYYSLTVSIPRVPPSERWLSYILLVAEAGGLCLIVIFSFYSLDAATRGRWTRVAEERPWDPLLEPDVAFIVPVYNEPVDVVKQTVQHLTRQDYPEKRYRVVVVDDSTDEDARRRLRDACEQAGAHYVTRETRDGFKAGAINHVHQALPPDVELISVIDADYWVAPDYLKSVVGYFTDPNLSFVQTPQDYRNENESFLTRQYKRAEAYFYHSIMPSRNEESAIIFCGTMGIMRRSALEDVGGFGEDQVCEDAEISVRLAANGWDSLYVDESYGEGLMPAVFEAYKKQFHRWAFGNVKVLFSRTGTILRSKRMKTRQKFDFIASNLHWFDGFFVLAIASILLYLGLAPLAGYDAVTHHQRELILLALVPFALIVDTVVRLHLVLRETGADRWRDAVLVQGMWFSIKLNNMIAVTKCMLFFQTPFLRTPKTPGGRLSRTRAFFRSLRLTKLESLLGGALIATAGYNLYLLELPITMMTLGRALLPLWLAIYATFFLCAPLYAYLSYRTLTPQAEAQPQRPPDAEHFELVDEAPHPDR